MWTWKLSSSKHRVTTDPPNLEVFKIDNAQDFFKNLDFIIEKKKFIKFLIYVKS